MPYLDIETRGRLVGMHQAGLPFRTILDLAGIPLTTVYNTINKYQRIGTVRTQKKRETYKHDRTGLPRTQPNNHPWSSTNRCTGDRPDDSHSLHPNDPARDP
ncbi:hypothetical protein O181_011113 [Austropuccinia psidii MF-1]|uniref:Uncharacterized protein n=1 Tax=Austropuccinia psidii MF-1 TaxID=1389203 RepID=A0A9Q3GL03_9BASI|nr:hypothetical protein [Austropuccinia psidii MF-1]